MFNITRFVGGSALTIAALGAFVGAARADQTAVALTGFSNFYNDADYSLGWQFTVGPTAITVTQLGLYTELVNQQDQQVGIFKVSDQSLVGSATVTNTDPVTGLFYYKAVSPFALSANTTYAIAGTFTQNLGNYALDPTGFAVDSAITFEGGRYIGSSSLVFPSIAASSVVGYFGPNFQFTAAAVPEPGVVPFAVASGLSLVGLIAARRKRPA